MKPIFHSKLPNGPLGDPLLYLEIKREHRALLFDLGACHGLATKHLLKVTDVFITHTHVDHFIGFDHLLRLHVGRDKHLRIFGPPGIINNVAGKLRAYTWNLVEGNQFVIEVREIDRGETRGALLPGEGGFPRKDLPAGPATAVATDEPLFIVETTHLDHLIPCLAFSLKEKTQININKDAMDELRLPVGSWLDGLKQKIREGAPPETPILVFTKERKGKGEKKFLLGEIQEKIVLETKGQIITYVTDALYSEQNVEKILELGKGTDLLFCEAAFLEEDEEKARHTHHLTARQAGKIASLLGVKKLIIFHFSPKYEKSPELLYQEAQSEFQGIVE